MSEQNENDELIDKGESVRSKADFVEFLRMLHADYMAHRHQWETTHLTPILKLCQSGLLMQRAITTTGNW